MNSLYIVAAVLPAVALIGSIGGTTLQQTVFAVGDPNKKETAKSQGERVSSHGWGDPDQINGHGEDVSDVARGTR
jgi:hypothetical protein